MKKHYEKMSMTPLGMDYECELMVVQGSIVNNATTVESMGQDVENYVFDQSVQPTQPGFHIDWE